MDWETKARERVSHENRLTPYAAYIWYDWPNWEEHLEWLATAELDDIVTWCEVVARDEDSWIPRENSPFG